MKQVHLFMQEHEKESPVKLSFPENRASEINHRLMPLQMVNIFNIFKLMEQIALKFGPTSLIVWCQPIT